MTLIDDNYDVIIIGAGISGLVCGCYLAKSGLKVLMVEQHNKVGGYCSSFGKEGYIFDVGVHYLGSCREGGIIYNVLKDLALLSKLEFYRPNPYEKIIMPDRTIFITRDKRKTVNEFMSNFPSEKENINRFFKFILNSELLTLIYKTKGLTFKEILNAFFSDYKLKSILSVPLGNIGLPPSKASALVSLLLYREYILDGGYYPKNGIQSFPNLLSLKFQEFGGKLLLNTKVKNILVKNKFARGVCLENGKTISTKVVISNCDATSTFSELLHCKSKEKQKIKKLKISASAFIAYLGINKDIDAINKDGFVTWLFSTYDVERCYDIERFYNFEWFGDKINKFNLDYLICQFPSLIDTKLAPPKKSIVRAMFFVNSLNNRRLSDELFGKYKEYMYIKIINKLDEIIPGIQNLIEIKEIASPYTLYKFTYNKNGAAFGWASLVSQINKSVFPCETSIKRLYLTGHWVTSGIGQTGVSLVALCGRNVADLILKKWKLYKTRV